MARATGWATVPDAPGTLGQAGHSSLVRVSQAVFRDLDTLRNDECASGIIMSLEGLRFHRPRVPRGIWFKRTLASAGPARPESHGAKQAPGCPRCRSAEATVSRTEAPCLPPCLRGPSDSVGGSVPPEGRVSQRPAPARWPAGRGQQEAGTGSGCGFLARSSQPRPAPPWALCGWHFPLGVTPAVSSPVAKSAAGIRKMRAKSGPHVPVRLAW